MKLIKNFNYKIQYFFIIIFIKLIKLFPEKIRFKFAEKLGVLFFKFEKKRKAIAIANLSLAFPDLSELEKEKIILKSYKVMFKAFMSTIWFEEYLKEEGKVNIINEEEIEKLISKYNTVIAACMHMGNMETPLKAAEKYPVVTVAKKQRNPYLDQLITENREKLNITLLKKSRKTAVELKKKIGTKCIIALFSDHRDKGAEVVFFGHPTIAPTGAVSLAMKNNLPLVLNYTILNDDNTSTVYVSNEIKLIDTGNYKEDLNSNMQLLINEIEKVILKYPEQWMWFHDRWNLSRFLFKSLKKKKKK